MTPREKIDKLYADYEKKVTDLINEHYPKEEEKFMNGMHNHFYAWQNAKEEWETRHEVERDRLIAFENLRRECELAIKYIKQEEHYSDYAIWKRQMEERG